MASNSAGRKIAKVSKTPKNRSADQCVLQCVMRIERLWGPGGWANRPGDAMAPHQKHMRKRQPHQSRRQQQHMCRIPPEQRQRTDINATPQEDRHPLPDERSAPGDVDRDRRRPIRFLIPGQEITGEGEAEDHEQEHDADEPCQVAWLLIRSEHNDSQHVYDGSHDDEAGAEHMKPPENAPEREAFHGKPHAVVRKLRRRHVVHRQDNAGEELEREQEKQHTIFLGARERSKNRKGERR